MRAQWLLVPSFALFLFGCPVGHQSPRVRAQEAASELAVNSRFGRMEMAAEHVSAKAREQFFERRRAWGSKIRIADYEIMGLKIVNKAEDDAEVYLKIAWYAVDSNDLHTTTLKQKWHDFKGTFQLVEETRVDGAIGLLGETVPAPQPSGTTRHAHFPTIRLGQPPPQQAKTDAEAEEPPPPPAQP